MNEERIRSALKACLSNASFPAERQREVLRQLKGERIVKKKLSVALVCAIILSLALAGAAIAAALGVFGQFGQRTLNAQSSERLQRLDEVAEDVNERVSLSAPDQQEAPAEAQTDSDRLLARQYGRTFEITLQQAYCDGNKLYYSYTLKHSPLETEMHEGTPEGLSWYMEEPGKRYDEVWSHDDAALDKAITDWLNGHERSWYAYDSVSLGDGARLANGEYLNILDSDYERVDETTLQGYQEVELPEDLPEGDTLTFELSVLYGTFVAYQDETGVYYAHITQPENRGILRVPFTVSRSGATTGISGEAAFEEYSARASLLVSDIDISGSVVIDGPETWKAFFQGEEAEGANAILSYALYTSDGQRLTNKDGSFWLNDEGMLEIGVRFDLPENMEGMRLLPVYSASGEKEDEGIAVK